MQSLNSGKAPPALPSGSVSALPPVRAPQPSDGKLRVHNAELFVECMQAADWSESTPLPSRDGVSGGAGHHAKGSAPTVKLTAAERVKRQREAFSEKQLVREHEFHMKLEVAKKEAERKAREKAAQREKQFDERLHGFVHNNSSLVQEVDGAVRADELWRQRKKERLFNEWSAKVFQPMQDQINAQLTAMTSEEVEQKRRHMFQCFLDESNKKQNGLFRDIVIESDYDPLQQAKEATLQYTPVSIADDPTKNRATREMGDRMTSGLLAKTSSSPVQDKRSFVSVEMWGHMEATPYGRYSNETEDPSTRRSKPGFLRSNVNLDHYHMVKGPQGAAVVKEELGGARGKKAVPTMVKSEIGDCFKMPGITGLPQSTTREAATTGLTLPQI